MPERSATPLLLVEDDPNLGATLSERLRSAGYRVTWARSLRESRRELAIDSFALAILDVGLPDGSGFDLASHIRSAAPATGVLFLTAQGDPERRIQGLSLGAEDYVVKPFHFQELLLRMENGLRRRSHFEAVPDPLLVGAARVFFASLRAERNGKTLALGHREAALLRFMAARRGAVVRRDEILDQVWSRDEYPTPRTVDNFVLKLRRIIESDPEKPEVLRTVWGVGYQLAIPPTE